MTVTELFEQECSFMLAEGNGYDCYVYPAIPEATRALARTNFGINKDENILLIRDTSFWCSTNQGLVITDVGFHCIVDNDNPQPFIVKWGSFIDVHYQELTLYFKNNQGEDVSWFGMDYFIKNSDDNYRSNIGKKLAVAFKKIAENVEPEEDPCDKSVDLYFDLIGEGKYQEAIDLCLYCIDNKINAPCFYDCLISDAYVSLKDWNKCIEYAQKGLKDEKCNDYENAKILLQHNLYSAYNELGLNSQARKECLTVMQNATDQKPLSTDVLIKDKATKDFQEYEEIYKEEFLILPYNERKVVMPVKKYVDLHQDHVAVIDIKNMPTINFPMGHPVANQLYVGHPLIPSKYIPFENYQLELVEDKVREFCILAQSLGATEISIECLNSASTDQKNNSQQNTNGETKTWVADGKGMVQKDSSRHIIDELSRSINLHQTFVPSNKPTMPEDMVWYDNEPSWQRLVSQRLNGNLTSHEERIETKKSQMIEGRELQDIKAEIKTLFVGMNMEMDTTEESKFTQQENAVLSIKVKFAPITQLTGDASVATAQIATTSTSALSHNEEEYLTELKEILADGEISPRERRLLEKIRIQSGISEERAAELENSLTALKLTEEEQEYLDEYKSIIADGEITERERRLLNKFRTLNGISEERAREIEVSVKR